MGPHRIHNEKQKEKAEPPLNKQKNPHLNSIFKKHAQIPI